MKTKTSRLVITWIAAAISGTALGAEAPPDSIYLHGKVVTVDESLGNQQAFAVRGDKIVAVGSDATIAALAGRSTKRVDLQGSTVIPGLSDNHDHLWNASKYLYEGVDLVGVTSTAELLQRVRAAVAKAKPNEVVYSTIGWTVKPAVTRQDLDQISTAVPIVLVGHRRGIGLLNSAALAKLGIGKDNPYFRGVKLPVDANGEPTGATPGYPANVRLIDAILPPYTAARQDKHMLQSMQERNSLGITSVRDLALFPEAVEGLQRLRREGKLTVRIGMGLEFPDQADVAAHVATLPPLTYDDPWLYVDSLAEEPWAPGSTTVENFTRVARAVNKQGWRMAPHVSSDTQRGGTSDQATLAELSGFEAADRDSTLAGKRWLVEHVFFMTPEQMERMAKLGVIVSTQYSGFEAGAHESLPAERMAHETPIRGFLDHNIVVIPGSDLVSPNAVERHPNNPMIPFYYYVTRKTRAGEVHTPDEKISREQALKLFTVNSAYAGFQEKIRGRLAPGMLADFVILNQDLMTVPEDKLLQTRPLATFVGGKKVYSAPGAGF